MTRSVRAGFGKHSSTPTDGQSSLVAPSVTLGDVTALDPCGPQPPTMQKTQTRWPTAGWMTMLHIPRLRCGLRITRPYHLVMPRQVAHTGASRLGAGALRLATGHRSLQFRRLEPRGSGPPQNGIAAEGCACWPLQPSSLTTCTLASACCVERRGLGAASGGMQHRVPTET